MNKIAINKSSAKVVQVQGKDGEFVIIYSDGFRLKWDTYVKEGGRLDP